MDITLTDGKIAGKLQGKIFHKLAKKSKHLFRKLNAWGVDYEVLNTKLPSDAVIDVFETEERLHYRTTVKHFKEVGTVLHFKEGTRDHYTQVFLPLSEWETGEHLAPLSECCAAPMVVGGAQCENCGSKRELVTNL